MSAMKINDSLYNFFSSQILDFRSYEITEAMDMDPIDLGTRVILRYLDCMMIPYMIHGYYIDAFWRRSIEMFHVSWHLLQ